MSEWFEKRCLDSLPARAAGGSDGPRHEAPHEAAVEPLHCAMVPPAEQSVRLGGPTNRRQADALQRRFGARGMRNMRNRMAHG